MTVTGADPFVRPTRIAEEWVTDLMRSLSWRDDAKAYLALRITLHHLRDRLSIEEIAQFGSALPLLVRGLFFEGWDVTHKANRIRTREEFVQKIGQFFDDDPSVNAEAVCLAVFGLLTKKLPASEVARIQIKLPDGIRELWPVASAA